MVRWPRAHLNIPQLATKAMSRAGNVGSGGGASSIMVAILLRAPQSHSAVEKRPVLIAQSAAWRMRGITAPSFPLYKRLDRVATSEESVTSFLIRATFPFSVNVVRCLFYHRKGRRPIRPSPTLSQWDRGAQTSGRGRRRSDCPYADRPLAASRYSSLLPKNAIKGCCQLGVGGNAGLDAESALTHPRRGDSR